MNHLEAWRCCGKDTILQIVSYARGTYKVIYIHNFLGCCYYHVLTLCNMYYKFTRAQGYK